MAEISKQALLVDNNQSFPDNNSGAITPVDLRSFNVDLIDSTVNQAVYTSNSSSWNAQIGQLNAFTASQQPSFTALNTFTASQLTINSGVNGFTQSAGSSITQLNQATASLQNFTSSINQILVNGASIGTSTRLFFNGFVSASIVPNVDGAIASITVLSDPSLVTTSSFNAYTASTTQVLNAVTASFNQFTASQNSFNQSATASIVQLLNLSSSLSGGYATQGELDQSASVLQGNINVLSSFTGSYATTGSNNFTGPQTLTDPGLVNQISLDDHSGSLVLFAKGYTSSSLTHISGSNASISASVGNIIFKINNFAVDTILSGSGNIFQNAFTATAGFKRYIGGTGNFFNTSIIPQISSSMQFSPAMNRNIGGGAYTFRAPVSSSTYTINDNLLLNAAVNFGTAASPFTGMVAGCNFNQNIFAGGTINMTSNVSTLDFASNINTNIIFGATVNINNNSSSVSYISNIQNGGITINNNYVPVVGSTSAFRTAYASINTVYGISHRIDYAGTNATTSSLRSSIANLLAGTYITASIQETGDRSSLIATNLMGNGLIVSGTSVSPVGSATPLADATYGTVISGRFNAVDGNRAKTAQTIFAVGTGTGYTNRKTGFLIDSGSNTFVEGTFNVSGSLSYTGSVYGNVSASAIASSTASIDLSVANYFTLTLSGSTRLNITNPQPGVTATLVINTSTGASASFSSNVKQPSGSFYAASPSGNIDIISFTAVDSTTVYAFPAQSFV
jgi:hypothetical protein